MIRWTPGAFRDLQNLHSWIAQDNPAAADATVEAIHRGLSTAETFPESGRKSLRFMNCRELILYPYLIVYRHKSDAIEVVAIIHGARRWPDR